MYDALRTRRLAFYTLHFLHINNGLQFYVHLNLNFQ